MNKPTSDSLLHEVHAYIRENYEEGCACPACGQLVKLYRRKLNSGMARILIRFYQVDQTKPDDDKWIMVSRELLSARINPTNMEYSKLAHWNLIESRGDEGDNTKSAGYWRLTELGRQFVLGQKTVPKRVLLYNGKVQGYDLETTTIEESLGNKFNYTELMGEA